MIASDIISNQEELSMLIQENKKVDYKSNYGFIRSHNGYRKGKVHLAIGPSSGGKSTLTRSLLLDFLFNLNSKDLIHIHLSEETAEEFLIELGSTGLKFEKIKQMIITSEQDTDYKSVNEMFIEIDDSMKTPNVKALFFDNITTSISYMDKNASEQAIVGKKFKSIASKNNKLVFLIAHTGGDSTMASNRLIEMNDIRGGKTLVNLVEFMYILQPMFVDNERHNIIRVVKHRGTTLMHQFFKLHYEAKMKMFSCDAQIEFKELKDLFNKRNVL